MLRNLQISDAEKMLEWMHDPNVVQDLQTNFMEKTIEDCRNFIEASYFDEHNIHYAIVDDENNYIGTVSLKNIDHIEGAAEFAITISASAMGKGYSKRAMEEVLKKGFTEYGLKKIYWCVSQANKRAIRFYDKNGYHRDEEFPDYAKKYTEEQKKEYIWYIEER